MILPFVISSCATYDTKQFRFKTESDKYVHSINLFENQFLKVDINSPIISYPNREYELGVNTEIRFWNISNKTITVDSIRINHAFNNVDITDSLIFDDNLSLPYSFKLVDENTFNLFKTTYLVDNRDTNFQVGDKIDGFVEIWFKIEKEPHYLENNFTKEYLQLKGIYTP